MGPGYDSALRASPRAAIRERACARTKKIHGRLTSLGLQLSSVLVTLLIIIAAIDITLERAVFKEPKVGWHERSVFKFLFVQSKIPYRAVA